MKTYRKLSDLDDYNIELIITKPEWAVFFLLSALIFLPLLVVLVVKYWIK